jgi:hypothetical protein
MRWRGSIAALAVLAALPAAAAAAPARLAFSAGSGLALINADGSGRTAVPLPRGTAGFGPAWSPDGARIALSVFRRGSDEDSVALASLALDGSGFRKLTAPGANQTDSSAAWSPDGSRIAFVRLGIERKRIVAELITIAAAGGDRRVVVRRASTKRLASFTAVAWAPDGSRLVYTRTTLDRKGNFVPSLRSVASDGSGDRLLSGDAGSASFSPDGARIAYTSTADRSGRSCGSDECTITGEIVVMNADGSAKRRLTRSALADDEAPAWSPDGAHIAFTSDRNFPDGNNAFEVYSVRPDGSCLTWLTNGSPASTYSAWEPGASLSSDPGACGAAGRSPLPGVSLKAARRFKRFPLWWLGAVTNRNLLVSEADASGGEFSFGYHDCTLFDPAACDSGTDILETGACDSSPQTLLGDDPRGLLRVRGALVYRDSQPDTGSDVYAGRTRLSLTFHGLRRIRATVGQLRRFGAAAVPAKLPAPGFSRRVWRRFDLAARALRQTGSEQAAARLLHKRPWQIRRRVAMRRKLIRLGARRLRC